MPSEVQGTKELVVLQEEMRRRYAQKLFPILMGFQTFMYNTVIDKYGRSHFDLMQRVNILG